MMSGMYAAISGLDAHQTMLDVTANNLSNVDTVGYKAQSTVFSDELSQLVAAGTTANGFSAGTNPAQVGLGVQVGSIDNVMTAGGTQTTGNPTDVLIQGNGWLRVANGNVSTTPPTFDATQYTRAGNLTFNASGYLCTQTGQYVLGYAAQQNAGTGVWSPVTTGGTPANNPIIVPPGSTNVTIGADGSVNYQTPAGASVTAGYISLATFPNQAGLQRDGGSLWSPTVASGAETAGRPGTAGYGQTISGELEQSNVDMGTEFTNMIEAERGYQANASTITTADQMMQTAVNMKQ
ncbi:MAG TPA: flagellar hook-basal body complex protein [Solirubrobacteraceae bacterium]|nr:flagellar hook-basal body complex protein [Solirubrobacteraceae bacterium]